MKRMILDDIVMMSGLFISLAAMILALHKDSLILALLCFFAYTMVASYFSSIGVEYGYVDIFKEEIKKGKKAKRQSSS